MPEAWEGEVGGAANLHIGPSPALARPAGEGNYDPGTTCIFPTKTGGAG